VWVGTADEADVDVGDIRVGRDVVLRQAPVLMPPERSSTWACSVSAMTMPLAI
jgi:hypothetical protein